MAVLKQYIFPDTPASGDTIELVPLAGNGYTSPHSYYAYDLQAEGASGGGSLIIQLGFDERYTSVVPYVTGRTNDIGADVFAQFTLASTNVDRVSDDFTLAFTNALISSDRVWEPPPIVIPGRPREATLTVPWLRFLTTNVDTEDYQMFGRIYNFKIDALKLIPLPIILASLPR